MLHTHSSSLIFSDEPRKVQFPLVVGEKVSTLSQRLFLQRVGQHLVVLAVLSHD